MLTTEERVVVDPKERRAVVLELVRAARKRLRLSLFRCNDAHAGRCRFTYRLRLSGARGGQHHGCPDSKTSKEAYPHS